MHVVREGFKDPVTDLGPAEEKVKGWTRGGDASWRLFLMLHGL